MHMLVCQAQSNLDNSWYSLFEHHNCRAINHVASLIKIAFVELGRTKFVQIQVPN